MKSLPILTLAAPLRNASKLAARSAGGTRLLNSTTRSDRQLNAASSRYSRCVASTLDVKTMVDSPLNSCGRAASRRKFVGQQANA